MNATQTLLILLVFLASSIVGYSTADMKLKVVLPALTITDAILIAAIVFWP